MLAYKFRIYPTKSQERLLKETLETCRHLYNDLLFSRIQSRIGVWGLQASLPKMKAESKYLAAVHSQVLQGVNFKLDKAFQAFFAGIAGHPKFRRKGTCKSFTYPQYGGFRIDGNRLKLSKLGRVRIRLHRPIQGTPKTCTIVKDIDQWYACISAEAPEINTSRASSGRWVGVDLGLTNIAILSDGASIPNPKFLANSLGKLKSLQRALTKKQSGSRNREKAKIRLEKAWRIVRRQRDDFAHKVSHRLTNENEFVVFEDLKIRSMVKTHSFASAIMDSTWGKLRKLTAYKAERRGGRVILVNPSGTSQKCSGCGVMNPKMKDLSRRVFECDACGLVLDRDVNAARNVLQAGQELARVEAQPLLVQRRRISKLANEAKSPPLLAVGSSPFAQRGSIPVH
jgi:putative transposase